MMNTRKKRKEGVQNSFNVFQTLLIVFVVLKLIPGTSVNDWHWIWVLSPLWIPFVIWVAAFLIFGLYYFIMNVGKKKEDE